MGRFLLTISATAFLLTTLSGAGAAIFPQNGTASAQDSTTERVTPGKRIRYPSFDMEVLVNGRPLTEHHARGKTYVEALRGAEYELRLRNSSPDRVAVALSVDGLNTIDAGLTSAWNASKWVIEPYQTITISGWQMSSERARRFYFTNERDSYAAKLGRTGNLGVISAVFFRERRRAVPITRSQPIYRDDREREEFSVRQESPAAKSTTRDDAATGIGRSVRHDVNWIDMELDSRPVAEITVRYQYSSREFCPEP